MVRANERGQSSRNSWEWADAPVMEIKGSRVRVQVRDDLSQTPTSAPEFRTKRHCVPSDGDMNFLFPLRPSPGNGLLEGLQGQRGQEEAPCPGRPLDELESGCQ